LPSEEENKSKENRNFLPLRLTYGKKSTRNLVNRVFSPMETKLIQDAADALRLLQHTPPTSLVTPDYFEKQSVVVCDFILDKDNNVMSVCEPIFNMIHPKDTFALKKRENNDLILNKWYKHKKEECDYCVIVGLSKTSNVCFITHSSAFRTDWSNLEDLSFLENYSDAFLELEDLEFNRPILFSSDTPFLLKEGQVRLFFLKKEEKQPKEEKKEEKKRSMSKPKTFEECQAKHADLQERLARLDLRKFQSSGNNTAKLKEYSTTLDANSDKKLISKYAGCLSTFENLIVMAEHDTTLPVILQTLDEIGRLLNEEMGNVSKSERTKISKQHQKFMAMDQNLVGKEKQINELLAQCKGLADGTIAAAPTPQKKSAVSSSGAPASSSGSKKENQKEIIVPEIQEDALSPFICDEPNGPLGYINVIKEWKTQWKTLFSSMVAALKNEQLDALYQKWIEEEVKVSEQTRVARVDNTSKVDVTLYVAYGEALKKIYEDTKHKPAATNSNQNSNGSSNVLKAPPKNIRCEDCGERRREFAGMKMCKECFSGTRVEPAIEALEQRADLLCRQAKREGKNGEEDGPINKLYEEYCLVNEKLAEAFDAFLVPNASVAAYERLKEVMDRADAMLPKKNTGTTSNLGGEDDEEEAYNDDEDVEDMIEHSDESSSSEEEFSKKRSKKRSHSNDSDEEEEHSRGEGGGLAHEAMIEMARLPVSSIRESILEAYQNPKRHGWLEEELKRTRAIKEVYGFTVQELWKDEQTGKIHEGEPEEWHTFFEKHSEAIKLCNATRIPDKVRTTLTTKRVEREKEEEPQEDQQEKKQKSE
jgi:hypothetical protein